MINEFLFANNATSTLAAPLSATATTATLAPGTGILFPQPFGSQLFALTFASALTPALTEIVYVAEMAGDTIVSMLRAQEGTAAVAWNIGDFAQAMLTAGVLNDLFSAVEDLAAMPLPVASYSYSELPAATGFAPGTQAFCLNGLNPGETAGHGTGCPVFVKAIGGVATWCSIWSGIAAAD